MKFKFKPGYLPACLKACFTLLLFHFIAPATFAQSVTGKVSDEAGKPLPGITVALKGSNTATTTDEQGQFNLKAGGNTILVFSSAEYVKLEVPVSGRPALDIVLKNSAQNMNEVVITAWVFEKKPDG